MARATRQQKKRKPIEFGVGWSILFVPLLFIGAGVSIPYSFLSRYLSRRKEEHFSREMERQERLLLWGDFLAESSLRDGTLVCEWLSLKGPVRWWWIREEIASLNLEPLFLEPGVTVTFFIPTDEEAWRTRYTDSSGTAMLISASYAQKGTVSVGNFGFTFKENLSAVNVAPVSWKADSATCP